MDSRVTVVFRAFLCALVLGSALPTCGMDSQEEAMIDMRDGDQEHLQQLVGDSRSAFKKLFDQALGRTEQADSTEDLSGDTELNSEEFLSYSANVLDGQSDDQIEAEELAFKEEALAESVESAHVIPQSEHLVASRYSWKGLFGGIQVLGAGAVLSYLGYFFGVPVYKRMMIPEFEEK